jgi:hypothetical protein
LIGGAPVLRIKAFAAQKRLQLFFKHNPPVIGGNTQFHRVSISL